MSIKKAPRRAAAAALVVVLVVGGVPLSYAMTGGGDDPAPDGATADPVGGAAGDPSRSTSAGGHPAETVGPSSTEKRAPTDPSPNRRDVAADGGRPSVTVRNTASMGRRARENGPAGSVTTTGSAGVALTFDDGPDPKNTPDLLQLLRKERVKATFCVVGTEVRAYPKLVRRIVDEGHTLCNHSWDHDLKLGTRSKKNIQRDLRSTNNAIRDAVPGARISYFRAPGGNFTRSLVAVAEDNGMAPLHWQVDPRDWDHPPDMGRRHTDRLVRTVLKKTTRGAIVLSHDRGEPQTITAYRRIIPRLKEKRFDLIALPAGG